MAFLKGHEFILKDKLGKIFNFYLNEQKYIEYIASDNKGKWKEKNIVMEQETENLHIEIDFKNHIHIISYHSNGELFYHKYNGKLWTNHLITQYPVSEQKVIYPMLKYVNDQIHIFYYLIHSKQRNTAYLLYINFDSKNYNTTHITTISNHSYINPFKIFLINSTILLLYGSVVDGNDQVFVSKYYVVEGRWDNPVRLTSSKDNKIYIDGLLDYNNNLHIVWSKYNEEDLVVQYLKIDTNELSNCAKDLYPVSLSLQSSCSFPTLVYYKNILWAIWTEIGKIASCYSSNIGENWSAPYIHENTKNLNFKRYRYTSNSNNKTNDILCDFVFGSLYPDIQFLGFGGEVNDEISTD